MCGICGVVSRTGEPLPGESPGRVRAMLASLAHRGPDGQGVHETALAVLGARRLAIRGVEDGHQPLIDRETGVVAVCNGEIDNHGELRRWLAARGVRVPQATDVAVLPFLYRQLGDAFVERLVGTFALALWDPRRQRLLLARDRAGERPLFFRARAGQVDFASELAALVATSPDPPDLDLAALEGYLRVGYFASPATPFAGVEKVGPAELVTIDAAGVRRRRWWRWQAPRPAVEERKEREEEVTLDRFDERFRRAVSRQTEVETECGVFLSGGVDSSLVAAVARAVRPARTFPAFTLRFPVQSYDEGRFAEAVAAQLRLPLRPVWVRPEDLPDVLPDLVGAAGEPLADPAWVPTAMLARRAAEECKVILVGEGGDELFGGYPTYLGAGWSERYARLPGPLRHGFERLVHALPPSEKKVTLSFLLKRFVAGAGLDGFDRHLLWTSNLSPDLLARLGVRAGAPSRRESAPSAGAGLLDLLQLHDLETSLAEGLLTKSDRAGTLSALELRTPFLDRDVMELAAGLAPGQRVDGWVTKPFLKEYARRYLPRSIVDRRKRGLSVPLAGWLRGPLREWARGRLSSRFLLAAGLEPRNVLPLFEEHRLRQGDHARALWALIVLSEWLDWVVAVRGRIQPAGVPAPPPAVAADLARG
jgi:asparagine synthase (glutamine-hydrolysing)